MLFSTVRLPHSSFKAVKLGALSIERLDACLRALKPDNIQMVIFFAEAP